MKSYKEMCEEVCGKIEDFTRIKIDGRLIQAYYNMSRDRADVVKALVRKHLIEEGHKVE